MIKEKLKSILIGSEPKEEKNDKRKIENIVVIIIIIVITIVAINYIWSGGDKKEEQKIIEDTTKKLAESNIVEDSYTSSDTMEEKLENILSKIEGVGAVKVLITYSQTSQIIPMYDEDTSQTTTEETDSSGGTRITNETSSKKDIIYEENDNKKSPITQSIVSAKIEGAIVIAEGAKNAEIKTNIVQAVEAVTGLSTYKIQVFEMKKN